MLNDEIANPPAEPAGDALLAAGWTHKQEEE